MAAKQPRSTDDEMCEHTWRNRAVLNAQHVSLVVLPDNILHQNSRS